MIVKAEIFYNIDLNLRSGSSGEGHNRYMIGNLFNRIFYLSIFRSEIMTPLRDTMGFIDGHKGNFKRL